MLSQFIVNLRKMRKLELLLVLFCFGIIFLGIMMKVSRVGLSLEGGIISNYIYGITDIMFVGNTEIISLAVLLVTIIPSYFLQLFLMFNFEEKINQIHTMMFYYAAIYACNISLYKEMSLTIGNAVLYLLMSLLLYCVVQGISIRLSKRGYFCIGVLAVIVLLVTWLEGMLPVTMLVVTGVTMLECVILSVYLGKSVILRKTLRRIGTILLFVLFTYINYNFWEVMLDCRMF